MTSVTNSSGLNYQNGINPLGRKVRALEADVDMLKKELNLLKNGGVPTTATTQQTATAQQTAASSTLLAEIDALKRDLAMIKLAGFGKGEKGDKGDKGDRGDRGETGPMTYIAMPANTTLPVPTTTTTATTVVA